MNAGRWEGDYIDIEGHRGRVELTITHSGTTLGGTFTLALATEDKPERYDGAITGTVEGETVVLQLETERQAVIVCRLQVAEPVAHAEQAAYGVVDETPKLKLGGGVLMAWRYKQ